MTIPKLTPAAFDFALILDVEMVEVVAIGVEADKILFVTSMF